MKIMNKLITLFSLICLITSGTWAQAQVPEKVIEAEGVAAVRTPTPDGLLKAKDEAINRALRRAVESGVGALVDSETMVQNYQLLDDSIYSQVKGYVKSYDILSDNNGVGDLYKVRVRAVVALAQLTKDIQALNIIKQKKNNPRVMVVFNELIDGVTQQGDLTASALEREFQRLNFPVIDKAQMQAIKERDAAMSYADPDKAVALGRRFGAEVVIVGETTSDLIDNNMAYGVSVFAYEARLTAKAIKVDTGQILTTTTVNSGRTDGGGRFPTAKKAIEKGARNLANTLSNEIIEKWRSEVFNTVSVQIVAENANSARRRNLKKDLSGIRGVQSVNERSFQNRVLILDVDIDGAMWKGFEQTLEALPGVGVEITGKTQNRIDVRLYDKISAVPVTRTQTTVVTETQTEAKPMFR